MNLIDVADGTATMHEALAANEGDQSRLILLSVSCFRVNSSLCGLSSAPHTNFSNVKRAARKMWLEPESLYRIGAMLISLGKKKVARSSATVKEFETARIVYETIVSISPTDPR